jgi:lysosomal acid lipase/cholesteryl ester hydrolase
MSYSGDSEKPFHLVLADEGYDVWIGNNRGTEYSQGHTSLDAAGETAEEYWDFTWAEMSEDVKANVSEIKRLTGE